MGIEEVFNVKKYVQSLSKEKAFQGYAIDAIQSGRIDNLIEIVVQKLMNDFNSLPGNKRDEALVDILSPIAYDISTGILKSMKR